MNKKFLVSIIVITLLILAGCKSGQTTEEKLQEKRACFKECMLLEDDKAYCLDDCDMDEKDIEEKKIEVCGDNVCQVLEQETNLCPEDCGCTSNAECETKEICESNVCKPVDCTMNSHCPENYHCQDNDCVIIDILDENAVSDMQADISDLKLDIQSLLDDIDNLQDSLDTAEGNDDDKDAIQEDIDELDTVITQLNTYYSTLDGYVDDLESVTKNSEVADVGNAFNATKGNVESYLTSKQAIVGDIEDAIAALEPEEKSDLIIDDFDLEDVDDSDATFTITIANDDNGNITTAQTFRIQLTSYELDNDTNDETRATITSGLEPDEETDVEMDIELPYDLADYFTDNPNVTSLILKFLVTLDIDNSINESDETNNNKTYNVTFDRDDYVSNVAPTAYIVANVTSILANENVFFNASASTDSDGTIASYAWNFGDSSTSTGAEVTHQFTSAATYTATVTVTDNDGATDTETVAITVS